MVDATVGIGECWWWCWRWCVVGWGEYWIGGVDGRKFEERIGGSDYSAHDKTEED